jgi:hypothetical protein
MRQWMGSFMDGKAVTGLSLQAVVERGQQVQQVQQDQLDRKDHKVFPAHPLHRVTQPSCRRSG